MNVLKIGIIREGKMPPDARVAFSPAQCKYISQNFPIQIFVEPSEHRCFKDEEYIENGISLSKDMTACDVLIGIKEVPIYQLIPSKTYFFFSHTIKKQAHNKALLQNILQKNSRLIDYEVITNEAGQRLIAFGYFAGIVGAHNGIMTWGRRTGDFDLPQMKDFFDFAAAKDFYIHQLKLPAIKIVLTGTGRVSSGAVDVLKAMGVRQVSPQSFLNDHFTEAVFTQLSSQEYVRHKDGIDFEPEYFYEHPTEFVSAFEPYTKIADIMINGIYWDNKSPCFFSAEDMQKTDFQIKVIADITCDIMPSSSVPSTLQASTIANPVYGYDVTERKVTAPYQKNTVDIMAIDNLPSELPRDSSVFFGEQFIQNVLPALILNTDAPILERATIAKNGRLAEKFDYLSDYIA
jgi:alanine dehydrogenase